MQVPGSTRMLLYVLFYCFILCVRDAGRINASQNSAFKNSFSEVMLRCLAVNFSCRRLVSKKDCERRF